GSEGYSRVVSRSRTLGLATLEPFLGELSARNDSVRAAEAVLLGALTRLRAGPAVAATLGASSAPSAPRDESLDAELELQTPVVAAALGAWHNALLDRRQ